MEILIKRLVLWNWRCMATGAVVGLGILAVYYKRLPPEVPLLYSRPWGQEQLVGSKWLWVLPGLIVVVGGGLTWLGLKMKDDGVLAAVVLATSLVLQAMIILGLLRIVMLVI